MTQLISNNFSCNISFAVLNTQFDCIFTKKENEICAEITAPEAIKGFVFSKAENEITLTYNGIGISADSNKLPSSVCGDLFAFFEGENGFDTEIFDDGIYLSKNIGGKTIYTVFDKYTFIPTATFDKEKSFYVTYSNYQLI